MDTMNRNSDVLNSTTDLRVPSGWEVESTTLSSTPKEGFSGRLNSFKSTCMSSVDSTKRNISEKINDIKPVVTQRIDSLRSDLSREVSTMRNHIDTRVNTMRDSVKSKATTLQHEMSSNPAKWAGIAAGVGMGLGVLGRYMRHRAHRPQPQFIIIEGCA
jgi:gas vesicle protein